MNVQICSPRRDLLALVKGSQEKGKPQNYDYEPINKIEAKKYAEKYAILKGNLKPQMKSSNLEETTEKIWEKLGNFFERKKMTEKRRLWNQKP